MAYEYDTKGVLLEWMKDGANKACVECNVPHPQWCSLSLGVSLCLACSGTHRSLGSHLSFVRSLTMDKWTPAQIDRMKAGGNAKCKEFFEANGQPFNSLPMTEKYNTHVATMYREKLLADAEGRPWIPSDPPALSSSSASSNLSSSGSLRKPRAGASGPRALSSASVSASSTPRSGSPATPTGGLPSKVQNEDFFSRMGAANDSRPDHLPPSQGGKYQGFGSGGSFTPSGSAAGGAGGANPLSSRNLPGLDDLRDDPVGALGKGWGFLGAALGAVGKTVNESVIQPGLERAHDPALQSQLSTFSTRALTTLSGAARVGGQVLSTGLESGSTFLRQQGVDVGDLGAAYVDRATGRGAGEGYGRVGEDHAPGAHSALEPGRGDFFGDYGVGGSGGSPDVGGASPAAVGGGGGSAGFQDMPRAEPAGSWADLAPQAAARKAALQKEQAQAPAPAKQKSKEEDEWESW
ncbi:ADP-ribosylation factor GTPase-activating protein gcs1 [Rhodotorula kratochvilovae]